MKNEILNKKDLVDFFSSGCKKKENWRVGTEHEKFAFNQSDLSPVNYQKIFQIFNLLKEKFDWKEIIEDGKIVALKKNLSTITLEPGGQIELSGAPMRSLFDTCKEVNSHQFELNTVSKDLGVGYMGMGCLPKWNLDQISLMPKQRYKIMYEYMKKVGRHGLDMMLRTCTIQANFDFESEKDMINKLRVSLSIQPAIIALYANSPFVSGKLTKFSSYRSWIWSQTDTDRCGILPFVFNNSFSFESYVDYLLDIPMYFVKRNNKYLNFSGLSFRDFMNGKLKGFEGEYPTLSDWDDHLTIAFPEVRLKKFIEVRGADGGPWSSVCALPAFWTGILYDKDILKETWELVKKWNNDQRQIFYNEVAKEGLKSKTPDGLDIKVLIKELLNLSSRGLKKRGILNDENESEATFLKPLYVILNNGFSPADLWKKKFLGEWNKNIDNIYKNNSF